jgi:hypothetical protein
VVEIVLEIVLEAVVGFFDHTEQRLNGDYFFGYDAFYQKSYS